MKFILGIASAAVACPMLVEYFPDPVKVSDVEGEYVEIRMGEIPPGDPLPDSLWVGLDSKGPQSMPYPSAGRLLLIHDGVTCPDEVNLTCGTLNYSLPNSREAVFRVWTGACMDSVVLDVPKAGYAFQRVGESDRWVFTEGTMGVADPQYEKGVADCGLERIQADFDGTAWNVEGWILGCDSTRLWVQWQNLSEPSEMARDSLMVGGKFSLRNLLGERLRIRLNVARDEAPSNDVVDTILYAESSPLVMTEVHHCPTEPEPEWVEVYNDSFHWIPLKSFRFCDRGNSLGMDSIGPFESLLITKDSSGLRKALGYGDPRISQVPLGFLSNTGGRLDLCYGDWVADSAVWDKSTVACPGGFNPHSAKSENTPGFQGRVKSGLFLEPLRYTLSSRVIRKKGNPLRIRVESQFQVSMKLLDSAGKEIWKELVPPNSSLWWNVPLQERGRIGASYVSLKAGDYETVVGVILGP